MTLGVHDMNTETVSMSKKKKELNCDLNEGLPGIFTQICIFLQQCGALVIVGHEYKDWCLQEFPQVREKALFWGPS